MRRIPAHFSGEGGGQIPGATRDPLTGVVNFLLTRRRTVLAAGALVTLFLAFAATRLTFVTSPESILITGDREMESLRDHEEVFGGYEHTVVLVLSGGSFFDAAVLRRVGRAGDRVDRLPFVRSVRSLARAGFPLPDFEREPDAFRGAVLANDILTPTLVARSGRYSILAAELDPAVDTPTRRGASITAVADEARAEGFTVLVAGVPAVRDAYARYIRKDLFLLPPLVGSILALLLFLAFRSIRVVVGLLGTVGVVAVWTIGILALTGGQITALTSILPSLIVVVGIATGVHVVAQHREERRRGADPRTAAGRAMRRMALPCGLTSLTTAVGFSSLVLAGIRDVREFGLYCAIGSLLAFIAGVPLVGILLSFDRGRSAPSFDAPLRALHRLLARRPWVGIATGVLLVVLSGIGMARLQTNTFLLEDVRAGAPVHEATVVIDRELGGVIGFELILTAEESLLGPACLDWLGRVEPRIRELAGVKAVIGPHTLLREAAGSVGATLTPALAPVVLAGVRAAGGEKTASSFISKDLLRGRINVRVGDVGTRRGDEIREECLAIVTASPPPGVEVRVAGLSLMAYRVLDRLVREMAKSTALAFGVIFLIMWLLFRSIAVGALAMIPNLLPLIVAAGFMGFAGITIRSSIALIFAVALGIAVDDTIHMITRYRRERGEGRDRKTAVARAIRRTGRPVVMTSLVLLAGFLAFAISDFKATTHFGLVASVTIVAALVGDIVVLPGLWLGASAGIGRGRERA